MPVIYETVSTLPTQNSEEPINIVLPGVMKTWDDRRPYYTIDTARYFGDPYIIHIAFDKLEYPPLYTNEVVKIKKTLEDLKQKEAKKTKEYYDYLDAREAYIRATSFASANEAANWLVRNGTWRSEDKDGNLLYYEFQIYGGNLYLHMSVHGGMGDMDIPGHEKLIFTSIEDNIAKLYIPSQGDYALLTRSAQTSFLWAYGSKISLFTAD